MTETTNNVSDITWFEKFSTQIIKTYNVRVWYSVEEDCHKFLFYINELKHRIDRIIYDNRYKHYQLQEIEE